MAVILGIGMRLLLIIGNTIAFNQRIVFLLRCALLRLFIQKTCCIKVDLFQIIIYGVHSLGTPYQSITDIRCVLCKEFIIEFHTELCRQ